MLPKEAQVPDCFKSFADAMREPGAGSVSDTDEEIVHWNMFNKFMHVVTSYPIDGMLELLWTDEDLARIGLSCNYAADYLGVYLDEL